VRTRVGYAGGTKASPTYTDLGDHTETFEVDYDPTAVSYDKLLKMFWAAHDPTVKCSSKQYEPIIFYNDAQQKKLAEASRAAEQKRRGGSTIYTAIRPATAFTMAEDYHQKYYLTLDAVLIKEIRRHYPKVAGMVGSTAAARLNGYVGGYGNKAQLTAELASLGLSAAGQARLKSLVSK